MLIRKIFDWKQHSFVSFNGFEQGLNLNGMNFWINCEMKQVETMIEELKSMDQLKTV